MLVVVPSCIVVEVIGRWAKREKVRGEGRKEAVLEVCAISRTCAASI
jgi:hypothetical protein